MGCFAIYKIYRRISGYKVSTLTMLGHSRYWFISWDYYAIIRMILNDYRQWNILAWTLSLGWESKNGTIGRNGGVAKVVVYQIQNQLLLTRLNLFSFHMRQIPQICLHRKKRVDTLYSPHSLDMDTKYPLFGAQATETIVNPTSHLWKIRDIKLLHPWRLVGTHIAIMESKQRVSYR